MGVGVELLGRREHRDVELAREVLAEPFRPSTLLRVPSLLLPRLEGRFRFERGEGVVTRIFGQDALSELEALFVSSEREKLRRNKTENWSEREVRGARNMVAVGELRGREGRQAR
ncbi:MAG: hypothetical protein ACKVPX_12025 [Myxococcaceae bacterium]